VSLRTRLIAGLLALATVGLVVLAGVTYAEQRSFLLDRVDQQARTAPPAVGRVLDVRGVTDPALRGLRRPGGARLRPGAAPPALRPGPGRDAPPPRAGGGPDDRGVNLPPGTYGERRSATGKPLGHATLSYGQTTLSPPDLSSGLEPGELTTVDSKSGSDTRYRVYSQPGPGGVGSLVVAVPLRETDQTLHRLLLVEVLVIAGVLAALGVLSLFLVRLGLRPLERIGETAGAIAGGDLSRRVSPATPRTEVGRLGLALNAMLARLERAFEERQASEDRLRRFLSDASHELRTPLASIRGYAELFRTGAARDEEGTAKAMRRIEDEAARMGVLVEDLLTLARLEEVRDRPREEVDLAALASDAVDDARVTDPGRPVDVSAERPALVTGDAHELRQVVGNLVRNAVVHTPAGTPVEVTVRRDTHVGTGGEELVLEVRDHGAGLPEGEGNLLFERFWRAERGRERGRAGAGLGLAIVAGIVVAHGGTAEAGNAAGGGARFTVRLPARGTDATAEPAGATA
jgi:two-component system, OmpR family, sensor kinase